MSSALQARAAVHTASSPPHPPPPPPPRQRAPSSTRAAAPSPPPRSCRGGVSPASAAAQACCQSLRESMQSVSQPHTRARVWWVGGRAAQACCQRLRRVQACRVCMVGGWVFGGGGGQRGHRAPNPSHHPTTRSATARPLRARHTPARPCTQPHPCARRAPGPRTRGHVLVSVVGANHAHCTTTTRVRVCVWGGGGGGRGAGGVRVGRTVCVCVRAWVRPAAASLMHLSLTHAQEGRAVRLHPPNHQAVPQGVHPGRAVGLNEVGGCAKASRCPPTPPLNLASTPTPPAHAPLPTHTRAHLLRLLYSTRQQYECTSRGVSVWPSSWQKSSSLSSFSRLASSSRGGWGA